MLFTRPVNLFCQGGFLLLHSKPLRIGSARQPTPPTKIMTLEASVPEVLEILAARNGDTIPAIRFLRSRGLSFQTAKTMVAEIKIGEHWWIKRTRR